MTCPDWSIEKIDASTLDNVGFMKYISGGLADPGELVMEMIFDPQDRPFQPCRLRRNYNHHLADRPVSYLARRYGRDVNGRRLYYDDELRVA